MEVEGEVVDHASRQVTRTQDGKFLIRQPHCECSARAIPVIENDSLVGWYCQECGPLTHDAIVYVLHPA